MPRIRPPQVEPDAIPLAELDALEVQETRLPRQTDVPPLESADVMLAEKNKKTSKHDKTRGKFPVKTGARRGGGGRRARG